MARTVKIQCKHCDNTFEVPYKNRKRKFCSRGCVNQFQTGPGNPSYGKVYRTKKTHPEWAKKVSATHKERGSIKGDRNPMKNPDTAKRVSESRKRRFREDPDFRQSVAEYTRQAWKDGKYEGVSVGRCRWFDYVKHDGKVCKVQGTWELAYAKWLDSQNISFLSHGQISDVNGTINYTDGEGNQRTYCPDFFLPGCNKYVEIKNRYHYGIQKKKYEHIRDSNPDLKIEFLFKEDLKGLGVDI